MYDYVLQFGFDGESQFKVQEIRNHIRQCGFVDRQRGWLPHITIDIYNCKEEKIFIDKVSSVVNKIKPFAVDLAVLDSFSDGVLFIMPTPQGLLAGIKAELAAILGEWQMQNRKDKKYVPHVTLCQNDKLSESRAIALEKFVPFTAYVTKVWMYNEKMELIKEWTLK